jgi:predicted DNA-binding transcriptional regulator AlpA
MPPDPRRTDVALRRPQLYDFATLSRITCIPVATLRRWVRCGQGPRVIRLGGRRPLLRFDPVDVEKWLASRAAKGGAHAVA